MILWFWASFPTMMRPHNLDGGRKIYIMVPGPNCLSLNVRKTKELTVGLQEETAATLHPYLWSVGPLWKGEQLQVSRLNISEDLTWIAHIQTQVKKARQRPVPSATAEKIQGLTSYPETFYSGAIEVYWFSASQCGIVMPQTRTAKLCRELCAWLSTSQGLLSPLCRTSTSTLQKQSC